MQEVMQGGDVKILLRRDVPKEVTREYVRKFHRELDELIKKFASNRGFTFQPGGLRFTSMDITTGRMRFVLKAKEMIVRKRTQMYSNGCKFNVGDLCSGTWGPDIYELMEFTRRGKALIKRLSDGRIYKCSPNALVDPKVKK